jgi:hypothetical protein
MNMANIKAYLIGDCQSNRVYEHYNGDGSMLDLHLWGKGGQSAWNFNPERFKKTEMLGSGLEHGENKTYKPFSFSLIEDKPENLIIAWFGYIDCKYKIHLAGGDCEKTAYKYLESLKREYNEATILLVEPLPQFIEDIYIESEKIPVFGYDIRRPIELDFCHHLKKFAKDFGITNYITQEEILEAIGLPVLRLKDTPDDRVLRIDGLKPHHNLAIYNLIIQKCMKIIS